MLLALPDGVEHAKRLAHRLDCEVVIPELHQFPDGEVCVRIDRDALPGDVAIVGNLTHDSFLKIAFLAGTARDLGATRIGLIAPYLAYMRQDNRFRPGEGVTAEYFGKLVSSVVDWMATVDPHLHRYDSLTTVYSIPTTVVRSASSIAAWVSAEVTHPLLVGPDAESVQWVAAVAERCNAPFVILEKTRRGDRDVSVSAPDHAFTGHTPIIIDDIVSTGRTMLAATKQLRAAGSAPPICIAIHAVFADAVGDELVAAGASGIVTCNTILHASNRICVADSLADAVRPLLA